jgi:hypothetical protein
MPFAANEPPPELRRGAAMRLKDGQLSVDGLNARRGLYISEGIRETLGRLQISPRLDLDR